MGKSLYIKRLADRLRSTLQHSTDAVHVTVPLHGPVVTPDTVLDFLQDHAKNPSCFIYHIDIAPSVGYCICCLPLASYDALRRVQLRGK